MFAGFQALFGQTLPPLITPRATGMAGAMVALSADPVGALYNPAGLLQMTGMGSDLSYGTMTGGAMDRLVVAYANPSSEEGARLGTGFYIDGQTKPGPWKYYVPYLTSIWTPMSRFALGATLRLINELPRADSLDGKWSNSFDLGVLTAGKNLNFGARVEHALGGTSVVPKTMQWGAALKSDNQKMNISYQWDGDLLNGISYSYEASRLGVEYITGKLAIVRAGYVWSDVHRITLGGGVGLVRGGSIIQFGWSFPTEGKAPTEWSAGLSYRI